MDTLKQKTVSNLFNKIFGLFFLMGNLHNGFAQNVDLLKYVNTLQGTNSTSELTYGNTYPTIALPFGMNTWAPQTGKNGDGWKYQYFVDSIRGFHQAHQCSSWTNDYAVFSLMPATELTVNENKRALHFSHKNEIAKPNYYKVKFNNNLTTEISPTQRGAHLRFSFPSKTKSFVILDGYTKMSGVKIFPKENKITGYVNNGRQVPENFKNYFVIIFDKPFRSYGTWENVNNNLFKDSLEGEGKGFGAFIEFAKGVTVQAKVASSYISVEQALVTLNRELGNFKSLEQTKAAAAKAWNDLLNRVLVEGGTEKQKATFYSCLFRASLFSREFFEYDKNNNPVYYSPYDGKVHDGYMYTDTGFWDTFRGQFPLSNILHPAMQGRYMQAMLIAKEQCGWLPSWSFPGEAGSMIGNHSISLFTDAYVKGIRTFDPQQALDAYYHEATNKGPWGPANGRDGWKEYFTIGYVPADKYREATAKTLEYAYDDFCAYNLAKLTGNTYYENIFSRQMYNYKNVFDSSVNFMRGRKLNSEWQDNFDPYEWGGPFTEGNAWHWVWSVFHDVSGLIKLMGGEKKFAAKLDSVFSQPNTVNEGSYRRLIHEMKEMQIANMGQYAHGNQPIQHMIYLYNYCNEPWKAQQHVRDVMDKLYNETESGYPGDEDQGQTSSWYVLSALGFYSVCPGTDQYVIGSPVFKKATITLENGKKFIIQADNNNKENVYIESAVLNGKPYSHNWIKYEDIMNGGELHFEMNNKPNRVRGVQKEDRPFSLSEN